MTVFWVCAVAGVAVAALGLLLDGVFEAIELFDVGPDWFSLPVIGVGVGAFGIAGLTVESATGSTIAGFAAGAVVGVAFFAGTASLMVALIRSRSDSTPTTSSVVGAHGRVITPIAPGVPGEVLLDVAGHTRKLSAKAVEQLDAGAGVVAIESVSDTMVMVMSQEEFWSTPDRNEGRNPQ